MEHRCLSPWKGAVAGGLIVYAWTAFSWLALPFHAATIAPFTDHAAVVKALEAEKPGVLVLADAKAPGLPFLFASRAPEGPRPVAASVALGLLLRMTGAFFWTWILGKIPGLTLKDAAIAWTLASLALSRCYAAACALPAKR